MFDYFFIKKGDVLSDYYHVPSERETKERFPGVNLRTFWGDKVMLSIVDLNKDSFPVLNLNQEDLTSPLLCWCFL